MKISHSGNVCAGGIGGQTWNLAHVRQALYYWATFLVLGVRFFNMYSFQKGKRNIQPKKQENKEGYSRRRMNVRKGEEFS